MTAKARLKIYQAELDEMGHAVRELNGDVRFQRFMAGVANLKDWAVIDACDEKTLATNNTTLAALGRIRAYQEIIDFVNSIPVELREVEPQP